MTKKEILKNFPYCKNCGECSKCTYLDICTNILPGMTKPNKCAGPYNSKK